MSFFHWIWGKSRQTRSAAGPEPALPQTMRYEAVPAVEHRKVRRQARREQVYVAIREAMTRAGVLSASYQFKVLSLDPDADEFFAMVDLQRVAGDTPPQLPAVEALIMQNARLRFGTTVSAVYWRVHEVASIAKPTRQAGVPLPRPTAERFEPVQPDEVTAFQQALRTASARSHGVVAEKGVKARGGPRFDDFEDTEVTVAEESPILSSTQYGDPN